MVLTDGIYFQLERSKLLSAEVSKWKLKKEEAPSPPDQMIRWGFHYCTHMCLPKLAQGLFF